MGQAVREIEDAEELLTGFEPAQLRPAVSSTASSSSRSGPGGPTRALSSVELVQVRSIPGPRGGGSSEMKRTTSARAKRHRPPIRRTTTGHRPSRASRLRECGVRLSLDAASSASIHGFGGLSIELVGRGGRPSGTRLASSGRGPSKRAARSRAGRTRRSMSGQISSTAADASSSNGVRTASPVRRGVRAPESAKACAIRVCQSS
jgi:hypothetical protein